MLIMYPSEHLFKPLDGIGREVEIHAMFSFSPLHGLLGNNLHRVVKIAADLSPSEVSSKQLPADNCEESNCGGFPQVRHLELGSLRRVRRAEEFREHSNDPHRGEEEKAHEHVTHERRVGRVLWMQIALNSVIKGKNDDGKDGASEPRKVTVQE